MSDFLKLLKDDLLDRRMRPLLIVCVVVLVAGVGYAVTSGSGSAGGGESAGGAPAGASAVVPTAASAGSGVSANGAAAETTFGAVKQSGRVADPFKTLAGATGATGKSAGGSGKGASSKASAKGPATQSPSKSSSTTTTTSTQQSGSTKTEHNEGSKHRSGAHPKSPYRVTIEFGRAPASATEAPHLVSFAGLPIGAALPSKNDPLVRVKAISASGTSGTATIALATSRAPIVSGVGICLPSSTECEAVKLSVGQSEELDYLEPDGQTVTYVVKLSAISKVG